MPHVINGHIYGWLGIVKIWSHGNKIWSHLWMAR